MATSVLYLRVSDAIQKAGASLTVQEAEGREYCAKRGYDVVEVVTEVETGVDSYDWRPGLKRVRDLLRNGTATHLVVWKFDRVNRDSLSNLLLLQLAEDTHTHLESVHDGAVENDSSGRMKLFFYGESGRNERDSIILRTRAGLKQRVAEGMPLVGKFPLFGYRYTYGPGRRADTRRKVGYELEPETAAIVRRCYEQVAAGYSLNKLTRELTQEGMPTPTQWLARQGKLKAGERVAEVWTRVRVHQILTNPSYTGRYAVNRHKTTKEEQRDKQGNPIAGVKPRKVTTLRTEGDSELVVLSIPPIVSEELFTQVQTRMTANRAESVRRNPDPESTLLRSGFAVCGHCGASMVSCLYYNPKRPHVAPYRVYRCNRHRGTAGVRHECPGGAYVIRASAVDSDTWAKATEIMQDTGKVQRLFDNRRFKETEELKAVTHERNLTVAMIAECETQKATLQRRMATEADDSIYAMLREESQKVNAILRDLERRHKAAVVHGDKAAATVLSLMQAAERYLTGAATVEDDAILDKSMELNGTVNPLAHASYTEKRDILRLLGVQVRMYGPSAEYVKTHDGARWEFKFQPESEPEMYSVSMRCQ